MISAKATLSAKFTVSAGRISQIRREFKNGWAGFCGEVEVGANCA
jgi:hypothetical protein